MACAEAAAAQTAKRVKGVLKGAVTYSPSEIAAGVYTVRVEAEGAVSRLGRSEAIWQGDVALDDNLQPTALSGFGWALASAQGGTLSGTITWEATSSTTNPAVYSLTGTFQSTSGTGKLQGASASGSVKATIDALTGKTKIELDGLMSKTPKKAKKTKSPKKPKAK